MTFILIYFIGFLIHLGINSLFDMTNGELFLRSIIWPIEALHWLITDELL